MATFQAQDPNFDTAVRESFGRLTLMQTIGSPAGRAGGGGHCSAIPGRPDAAPRLSRRRRAHGDRRCGLWLRRHEPDACWSLRSDRRVQGQLRVTRPRGTNGGEESRSQSRPDPQRLQRQCVRPDGGGREVGGYYAGDDHDGPARPRCPAGGEESKGAPAPQAGCAGAGALASDKPPLVSLSRGWVAADVAGTGRDQALGGPSGGPGWAQRPHRSISASAATT